MADVPCMALYTQLRVQNVINGLAEKDVWTEDDTAAFDCMHYLGNEAIEIGAAKLGVKTGDSVLDIGSGYSGTGRYLHRHYGANVIGIEIQQSLHDIAVLINRKNGVDESVKSINTNVFTFGTSQPVDYIISMLCILHIEDRPALFSKLHSLLEPGGKMYIEDYFARGTIDPDVAMILDTSVSCTGLPLRTEYETHLRDAGFKIVGIDDVSDIWAAFVKDRAAAYRQQTRPESALRQFYDDVDIIFASGQVGGLRILCEKME